MEDEGSKKALPQWEVAARGEGLSGSIVRQIREALFSGKLKSGDFLGSEITLAQQFGVSRIASRDALRALIATGIVEIRMGSRGGAWVAAGNSERLVDALAIQLHLIGLTTRELLESQSITSIAAAELAAGRATAEDLESLRAAAHDAQEAASVPRVFDAASMRFRQSIVQASKNRVLIAQYRAFGSVLGPLLAANTTPTAIQRIIGSNAALLDAIVAKDGGTAGALMREREAGIQLRILGESAVALPHGASSERAHAS